MIFLRPFPVGNILCQLSTVEGRGYLICRKGEQHLQKQASAPVTLQLASSSVVCGATLLSREYAVLGPLRSPDLIPLDLHIWGYVKNLVYDCKVDTRDEILQRIFDATRRVNGHAFPREFSVFLSRTR